MFTITLNLPSLAIPAWDPLYMLHCLKMAFVAGFCNLNSSAYSVNVALYQKKPELRNDWSIV